MSLHVELGKAFPHEPGGPEAGDGRVHLQRSLGELLMRDARERQGGAREFEIRTQEAREIQKCFLIDLRNTSEKNMD